MSPAQREKKFRSLSRPYDGEAAVERRLGEVPQGCDGLRLSRHRAISPREKNFHQHRKVG